MAGRLLFTKQKATVNSAEDQFLWIRAVYGMLKAQIYRRHSHYYLFFANRTVIAYVKSNSDGVTSIFGKPTLHTGRSFTTLRVRLAQFGKKETTDSLFGSNRKERKTYTNVFMIVWQKFDGINWRRLDLDSINDDNHRQSI